MNDISTLSNNILVHSRDELKFSNKDKVLRLLIVSKFDMRLSNNISMRLHV